MKVINILEEGIYGGPQRRVLEVAKRLKSDYNIETEVLLPDNPDSDRFIKEMTDAGVQFTALKRFNRITKDKKKLLMFIIFFIPELIYMYRWLKKKKPAVVHCNGAWQIKGVIASRLAGVKNVWHLNDTSMPWFIRVLFKIVARLFTDSFILACERTKEYYINSPALEKRKCKIIQAPVDTVRFNPEVVENNDVDLLKYKDHIKVLTVSNVNFMKGLKTFIRMAHQVTQMLPNEKLIFIVVGVIRDSQLGYYNELLKIQKELKVDNLIFTGPKNNIPEVLKGTDIYVCSSNFEASPISVWESLSMAKPVASTDVGDVKKIFEENKCGLVVPTQAPKELAEIVIKLIQDKTLAEQLGKQARETALNKLDINACVKRHSEMYKEIAKA